MDIWQFRGAGRATPRRQRRKYKIHAEKRLIDDNFNRFVSNHPRADGRVTDRRASFRPYLLIDNGCVTERPQGGRNFTSEVRENHPGTLFGSRAESKSTPPINVTDLAVRVLTCQMCHDARTRPTRHDDTSGRS